MHLRRLKAKNSIQQLKAREIPRGADYLLYCSLGVRPKMPALTESLTIYQNANRPKKIRGVVNYAS